MSPSLIHEYIGFVLIVMGLYSITHQYERSFVKINTVIALVWCFNFLLIGATTAAVSAFLIFIRTWASLSHKGNPYYSVGFILLFIVAGLFTYQEPKDFFPVLASIIGTIAYFHLSGIKMRIAFVVACFSWIIHNISSGSMSSSFNEAIGATLHLWIIMRLLRKPSSTIS